MNILKITDVMQMIKLGKRASGWIEADILNWIQNKQTMIQMFIPINPKQLI